MDNPMAAKPILSIQNLEITFPMAHRDFRAVKGVSFDVGNEKVGLIGESGSGKSLTGRSILRLLPGNAQARADAIRFEDRDLLGLSEAQMREIRGSRIAMILQDPKFSLNPVMTVGKVVDLLERVHIRNPERVYGLFPHEVSGGMGQRIMIAMMIVARPSLIIADEPTSALDVSVRQQVLRILDELREDRPTGLLFITHDLNLVRSFCDRVVIMYAGQVMETLEARDLDNAKHPYTQGLLEALPRLDRPRERLSVLKRDPEWLKETAK